MSLPGISHSLQSRFDAISALFSSTNTLSAVGDIADIPVSTAPLSLNVDEDQQSITSDVSSVHSSAGTPFFTEYPSFLTFISRVASSLPLDVSVKFETTVEDSGLEALGYYAITSSYMWYRRNKAWEVLADFTDDEMDLLPSGLSVDDKRFFVIV